MHGFDACCCFIWFNKDIDICLLVVPWSVAWSYHYIAIQLAICKILIAVFLTCRFNHNETNYACWTREIVWSWFWCTCCIAAGLGVCCEDHQTLVGHIFLFMMMPCILIPYVDHLHATLCYWFWWHFSLSVTIKTTSCSSTLASFWFCCEHHPTFPGLLDRCEL